MKVEVLNKVFDVRKFVNNYKNSNKIIGFVPTMGALHEGHLALVNEAKKNCDIVIVSIFVNKAQFNDKNDYLKYPRNFESDIEMLKNCGVDAIFIPDELEIYPQNFSFKITPTTLVDCLCAISRRGHFDGVALVVAKLFNIVQPNIAFFGEKDFQQLLIIKKMVSDLNFDIQIKALPTQRELNGLAMSSRNMRLSHKALQKAPLIYQVMQNIKINPESIELQKIFLINNGFEIDYLEIREEDDLKLNNNLKSSVNRRIFIAVYLDGIRLIDNLKL